MSDPNDDAGMMNICLEDCLALATTEEERMMVIKAWLRLGVEYAARQVGKVAACDELEAAIVFVMSAEPDPPWPP